MVAALGYLQYDVTITQSRCNYYSTKILREKSNSFKTILLQHRNFWLPIMIAKYEQPSPL